MKSIKKIISNYTPYIVLISILLYNLELYFTHSMLIEKLFDSDCIYLPRLYKDIFIDNGSYSSWYGAAAPYYFPDMLIYFISNTIFSNIYYAIPLYFTINTLIIFFILFKIYQEFYDKKISLYLSAISISMIYIFKMKIDIMLFTSVFHFGEVIISLIGLYLVLKILDNQDRLRIYLALFILSSFTVASDKLYLVHFILPTIVVSIGLYIFKLIDKKRVVYINLTLFLSMIFGWILYRSLTLNYSDYAKNTTISFKHFYKNIDSIISIFKDAFHINSFITIVTIFVYIATIFIVVSFLKHYKEKKKSSLNIKILYLILYLIIMTLGNLSSATLLYPQSVYEHYLIPLFIFPIFMIPIIIKYFNLDSKKGIFKRLITTTLILLYSLLIYKAYTIYMNREFKSNYYPFVVSCVDKFIDKTKAKYGIAGYWESKSVEMLSHHKVNIAQFNYNLDKFLAVNSTNSYRDFYDFAIIKNGSLNRDKIIQLNGEPTKIFKCEDGTDNIEILYYQNGLTTNRDLAKLRDSNKTISPDISNRVIKYDSKSVIFKGWYSLEDGFRWSKGKSSKIVFKIDPDKIRGYLYLDIIPLGKQDITIYINSHKVSSIKRVKKKNGVYLVAKFPKRWLFRYDINEIKILFSNPHQPNSRDKRDLAVAIKSFKIE